MAHIFTRYFKARGHYPKASIADGVRKMTVTFHPGYVTFKASPPYSQEIHITRSAWLKMLPKLVRISRKWEGHPDHDVPKACHSYYLQEVANAQDLRAQKRDPERQRRQRQRWLAAKARAERKAAEPH